MLAYVFIIVTIHIFFWFYTVKILVNTRRTFVMVFVIPLMN